MPRAAKSRQRRNETAEPVWIKLCMVVDIPDVVTYTNFGDNRLRSFWVTRGQISPFPIDFHRRYYNTLAIPCERVIRTYLPDPKANPNVNCVHVSNSYIKSAVWSCFADCL